MAAKTRSSKWQGDKVVLYYVGKWEPWMVLKQELGMIRMSFKDLSRESAQGQDWSW